MSRTKAVLGGVVGATVLSSALGMLIGRATWRRGTARAIADLNSTTGQRRPWPARDGAAWESLPPPVRRYLRFALPDQPQPIHTAIVEWSGEFQMRPNAGWVPFKADQHFSADPPGFVWDARVRIKPMIVANVRDTYTRGRGSVLARLAGIVPLASDGGTPETAQSALARWLGEAVWFPTAFMPGGPVRWEPVDENTAVAIVGDGRVEATATFHFASSGEIRTIEAMRYRSVGDVDVLTPFEGRLWDYAPRSGVMVPTRAEVAWITSEGRFPYWRGSPERIEYTLEWT